MKIIWIVLTSFLLIMAGANAADAPWYTTALVGMEVGPTGAQFGHSDASDNRYCAVFNGRDIVEQCREAGSEYLVMWVRDGDYAYYNSTILPKAPGLGERDPLREAVDAAAAYEMPVIAYCVVQQGGHFLEAHPEYAMRDMNGSPIGRFCYNSGYLEAVKEILAEQLAYGIQGFHIDMLDQGFGPPYGCWCEACRQAFETEYGWKMPAGVTWDEDWDRFLEFRYKSSERFMRALYAHVTSIDPNASVDFNYHGNPPFSFEVGQRPVQHAGNADFVTGETGVWGFSALTVGLNVAFYRAATPGRPVQVAMQRGVRMYHDQTTRPLADIRWELLSLLAQGAFVTMVDKTGFDGGLDAQAYKRIGEAFREVHAKQAHFGQAPVADVGLYFSHRSRDWVGREQPGEYFASFQGAHKAMVYAHIPWGVVLDENVNAETLQRFPVVILPNAGILRAEEVDLFSAYVEKGGKLIITGLSGCYDRMGVPAGNSALEALIGAQLVEALPAKDNWVRLSGEMPEPLRASIPVDWPFLVKGPAAVYEPDTAQALGELLKPYRTTRQKEGKEGTEWPMSPDTPVGPALLLNQVGKGEVLTFAASPDYATASEHAIVEARRLLVNAVRYLHPNPRVQITAPVTVQAVVSDDSETRTLRVHLLSYNSPPQTTPMNNRPYILPGLIEDTLSYRATITTSMDIREVTAFNPETRLSRQGNEIELIANDIHEIVLLYY
ncbi:MAG TPA: beta-galactosidase trimerization domain-containing protein [Candidatus Hydrogenedentes bacterium]|nr:beta-galactosidase trimerization domain-containing protein [Candidatus Hydrogenedentota bacterium]